MPAPKKSKSKSRITETDVIMPGYKYPKGFKKLIESQRKKSKKK